MLGAQAKASNHLEALAVYKTGTQKSAVSVETKPA